MRADRQGAGDADPLLLAAGELRRFAVQQMFDAQQGDGLIQSNRRGAAAATLTIAQVLQYAQMGEQVGILKHIADGPAVGR